MILIKKSGKSINKIERDLDYPRNAIHNYKNGGEPSGSRLIELSNYFNVSPEYLLGKSEKMRLSTEELFMSMNLSQKLDIGKTYQEWIVSLMSDKSTLEMLLVTHNLMYPNYK